MKENERNATSPKADAQSARLMLCVDMSNRKGTAT